MTIDVKIDGPVPTTLSTERVGAARAFLRDRGRAGSAVTLTVISTNEEAYDVLRALATLKEKRP